MPRKPPTVHGMALIDKPSGMTSHDVVAKLRKRFNERRIGHAGTLDPDATGVLVIGIGSATRLLRFATASFKTYEVEIVFGLETTTLDSSGDVVKRHLMSIDEEKVLRGVEQLTGEIEQTPPMVSARRVDGRRLHEIAREGGEVERKAQPITVSAFEVEATPDPMIWKASVSCSSGTYVRSLGADLGAFLGGGAHIRNLRRIQSGHYTIDESLPIDEAPLLPVEELVRGMNRVVLLDEEVRPIENGGRLASDRVEGPGPWALFGPSGTLLAVHEKRGGRVVPSVVLPAHH